MRKLIYSMGVSLDGFIAGPSGEIRSTGRRRTRSCIGSTTSRLGRWARTSSDGGFTRRCCRETADEKQSAADYELEFARI
jgi:hypothetical protein